MPCSGLALAARRRMRHPVSLSSALRLGLALALALTAALPTHAEPEAPLVVRDDPGGSLIERREEVLRLARSGRRVEIRGPRCFSACTLYLGLRDLCIEPQVRFGFHGPASQIYGIALPPEQFDHWSRHMAAAYPPELRAWFLRSGRHVTVGLRVIPGRRLISMGIPKC